MLVCVLLVAALAGQPAWGDADKGTPKGGHAQSAAGSGSGPSQGTGNAVKAKSAGTAKANRKARAKKAAKAKRAPKARAKTRKARKSKSRKKSGARQAEGTTAPPPEPPPPPPEETPDPTPTPENEPPPVDIPAAPPEVGAESPAPAPATQEVPPDPPAAPEETPNPHGKSETREPPPSQSETAAPGSTSKKITDSPQADTPLPTVPGTPAQTAPGQLPSSDGTVNPAGQQAPGTTDGGALPSGQAGTTGGTAGTPANPIVAGTTLLPAAQQLVVRSRAAEASRPQRNASGVGSLQQPTSVAVNALTNLVKDIPAWIKLALAGLAALVLLLGAYTIVAAARTRRLERQRSKLMEDIGLLQAALLPAVPGRLGALLTTVAYRPADGPAAGGDFYDAFALSDGRVGLLLGDISGHGRQALAKTTLVRFTVRAHLEAGMSPREALAISGRSLDGRLADDFSTVIAAIHDPVKGTLTYASAGHPPPLVAGPQAHEPVTASSAPPIGAGFPTGQRQTVLPMPEGTTVCVYSDGLLEARINGDALGRDRLGLWLRELGPEASAKALLDLVVERADRVPDDLAACVVHAAPGATGPAARLEQLKLDVLDVEGPELDGFLKACGVSRADRAIAGRRVSEQLAVSGGVVVDVRIGEHPMVSVASIGDHASGGSRPASRVR
ncbi:MAG: PP2C family protein-serine/threonine phosphatase [Solirubrobacteraceae bacterium]